ncbi:MAG: hypothetical protein ACKVHQ_08535 [Gammaproteobacteria bacterium]|jgi:hypothetical protein
MFSKKNPDNTEKNRKLKEANYLDGLCNLAIERHFNDFVKSANNHQFSTKSVDEVATILCEALVKDLEYEIWQRIAPNMMNRVNDMKILALDATGENKIT